MNKAEIIKLFITQLEQDLLTCKQAAIATYEAATHEENKPENEYDTRGLEASYLAGAQAKRAHEIDEVLSYFKTLEFPNFTSKDPVQSQALIQTKVNNNTHWFLVMPKGGGSILHVENTQVQIITPHSNIGEALLGLHVGDLAEVEIGPKVREYEILSIY